MSDVARRVDDASASSKNVPDLFKTNTEVQRQKLRDNCEKLLLLDPVTYGKKALELLWRKVYYDTVSTAKKLRNPEEEYDNYLFTHIVSGIGHFHHLITKIQSQTKLKLKEVDYVSFYNDEDSDITNIDIPDEELQQWGRSAIHSCLIYLGDLSRYQAELFHTFHSSIAARYYLQAAHFDHSSGMPYNQLGNLYMEKNYNLSSVCYYIHCLSRASPFEGASGNLMKLFEKNGQIAESLGESKELSQSEQIQGVVSKFLSLIEIWYFSKEDSNIPQRCNIIAQELKIALDFEKQPLPDINKNFQEYTQVVEDEVLNPSHLNSTIIHEIVQICIFTISKLVETDDKRAFAAKAFSLALLSQLLHKFLQQLQALGFKNPASKYWRRRPSVANKRIEQSSSPTVNELPITNGIKEIEPQENEKQDHEIDHEKKENNEKESDQKTNKKNTTKRRRRRRVASSESSDLSNDDTDFSSVDTDESDSNVDDDDDDDHDTDSSYHTDSKSEATDNDLSDSECLPKENEKLLNGDLDKNESIDNNNQIKQEDKCNSDDKHIVIKYTENNVKSQINKTPTSSTVENLELMETKIQNFFRGENFLPSIKLLQDWILKEKELILSCGESGQSLFQCVVDLLNILEFYFKHKLNNKEPQESCKIFNFLKAVTKNLELEYRSIPLTEDINLRGTNICKFDTNAAEWSILNQYKPSIYEENVIRILNFIDFGHQITKIVPKIRFNRTMQIFYLKKSPAPKVTAKVNHRRTREWHNSKKAHVSTLFSIDLSQSNNDNHIPKIIIYHHKCI